MNNATSRVWFFLLHLPAHLAFIFSTYINPRGKLNNGRQQTKEGLRFLSISVIYKTDKNLVKPFISFFF